MPVAICLACLSAVGQPPAAGPAPAYKELAALMRLLADPAVDDAQRERVIDGFNAKAPGLPGEFSADFLYWASPDSEKYLTVRYKMWLVALAGTARFSRTTAGWLTDQRARLVGLRGTPPALGLSGTLCALRPYDTALRGELMRACMIKNEVDVSDEVITDRYLFTVPEARPLRRPIRAA